MEGTGTILPERGFRGKHILTAGLRQKARQTKIFVTVGTHPQQFDSLLSEVDRLAGGKKIAGKIFAQTGHSAYEPKNFAWKHFLTLDEFRENLLKADVVITHAGEGTVGECKNLGKKMIAVPRRKERSEHTNDHQLELAEVVEMKKMGLVAWQPRNLEEKISALASFKPALVERGRIPELLEEFTGKAFV